MPAEQRAELDPGPAAPDPELLTLIPYAVALGIELESATAQQAVGHLDWAPERCTAGGVLHGGALMSLADSVAAVCAFLGLPDGASTTTASSTTHLFRAVRAGRATATSPTAGGLWSSSRPT
jgi:1,4-dihydroxy-2-naphthoyl-CoA hydrolase